MACPCPPAVTQPWHTRDNVWSPASFIGGLLVVAFGVLALAAGLVPWVGYVTLGVVAAVIAGALVVQARRGHRGFCLARRAVWFGIATPGAPVRLLANAP